jgi:hypothetical protein
MNEYDEAEDMANVGRALIATIASNVGKDWHPAECPSEIVVDLINERDDARAEVARLTALINTPHTAEFLESVKLEAVHQRERWAADHDAGKTDADWFWLVGYLAGKALHKPEKQVHHIITTAAALLNWHAAKMGVDTRMRPGITPPSTPTVGRDA